MKLPIYEMIIDDEAEKSGVTFVALVDDPAIERDFMAFSKEFKFIADNERRIITGPLMIADMPIYRRNEKMGEFYVVFRKAQIERMVQDFFSNGWNENLNEMHTRAKKIEGAILFESFIVDSSRGIAPPKGFEDVPDGSWFGSYKITDDKIWEDVKSGKFRGYSIEAENMLLEPVKLSKDEELLADIKNLISKL
jgi:hypothetical protein